MEFRYIFKIKGGFPVSQSQIQTKTNIFLMDKIAISGNLKYKNFLWSIGTGLVEYKNPFDPSVNLDTPNTSIEYRKSKVNTKLCCYTEQFDS